MLRRSTARSDRIAYQAPLQGGKAEGPSASAPSGSPQALVFLVDDDDSVRKALSRTIRTAGLDVQAFPSAPAFLAHTPPDCPACLVLDVRLPGTSGLDLQETLKQAGREMPIVFITGHGDVPMTVRAMKAGALDLLEKPFRGHVLLETIRRALERARAAWSEDKERRAIQDRVDSLTRREREVLALVVAGLLNKQIGGRLGASEKTIKIHRGRMMQKMGADSVAQLVRLAKTVGIG